MSRVFQWVPLILTSYNDRELGGQCWGNMWFVWCQVWQWETDAIMYSFYHIEIIFPPPKNSKMKQWYCSQINYSTKKPWLNSLALAFQKPKPGQSCHKAIITAQLGLAYLGRAWLCSWPQAGPGTALHEMDLISAFCHTLLGTICCPAGNELMVKCWQIRDV